MIYLFLSVFFYAIAALLYKHSNQINCDKLSIIAAERISAVVLMILFITFFDSFKPSLDITIIAFIGGITIFISRVALLASLKYGKISSSWTAVNLSVVIPVIASIFFWNEIPNSKQMIGLFLVPLAIFLLQEDRKEKKCG
ncbi:MAG: DMT family transporter [Candidatus Omnitrophica bacterium]|nr:DMT family transporter [Candidatus Omnitrophota bacterium]MCM8822006.1 DMT family transporter [Candidatus Omnitrophota bacterium]MCM8824792.1 DMT family transporter [Candidatus Omnitrophota bacterium]MCM8828447.1 DMT family transporter [Candidatus Omnitrophota bacterium]